MTQPVTILQISDLHRDPQNPIRNDALLSSLENDRRRYTQNGNPVIRPPDIIVVSGDVIHGVAPGNPDYQATLEEQHREALQFLGALADRLLAGDRTRVVLVPGNHDVSACHFMESVQRVDVAPDRKKDLVSQLFHPDSPLRWSWHEFTLFEVCDPATICAAPRPFRHVLWRVLPGRPGLRS